MKPLDMRDISIMDAFPMYKNRRIILTVGCGEGRIEHYLVDAGYRVYATDIKQPKDWDEIPNLEFSIANIYELSSFPIPSAPVVICSEVLEHLSKYEVALWNLLKLTDNRLIITVPYKKSFGGVASGHISFWNDITIRHFEDLCKPYSVSITRIRTKKEDIKMKQWCYLIVVDKRQNLL